MDVLFWRGFCLAGVFKHLVSSLLQKIRLMWLYHVAIHLSMWQSSDNHFKPISASKGEEAWEIWRTCKLCKNIRGLRRKRETLNIPVEGKTTKHETCGIVSPEYVFKQSTRATRAKHSLFAQAGAAQELCGQLQIWQKLAVPQSIAGQR